MQIHSKNIIFLIFKQIIVSCIKNIVITFFHRQRMFFIAKWCYSLTMLFFTDCENSSLTVVVFLFWKFSINLSILSRRLAEVLQREGEEATQREQLFQEFKQNQLGEGAEQLSEYAIFYLPSHLSNCQIFRHLFRFSYFSTEYAFLDHFNIRFDGFFVIFCCKNQSFNLSINKLFDLKKSDPHQDAGFPASPPRLP